MPCLEKYYSVIIKIIFKGGNIFDWRELEGKISVENIQGPFFVLNFIQILS